MTNNNFDNNQVKVIGKLIRGFEFRHEVHGESFYMTEISIERLSGISDNIPVMVSERLIDVTQDYTDQVVSVYGRFSSFNYHDEDGKSHCILYVFAKEIYFRDIIAVDEQTNDIFLDGYIVKKANYRKTPFGRDIADFIVAVNRNYGKSDYIPVICWGRNALFISGLQVGSHVKINGRIQSREYNKKINDNEFECRTAYEVSASRVEWVREENADE